MNEVNQLTERAVPNSGYLRRQLTLVQEEIKSTPARLKEEERKIKQSLKLAEAQEEEERKAREAKALEEVIQMSKRDRRLLNNLQSYYSSPNRWEGSPKELELLVDYLETRIKAHTEFIANPVI